jgi:glycosyltransferase involved in cell wall biosynthesis
MRIAMFSWEALHGQPVGGVAAHVTELAAALCRRGHELHVFTRPGFGAGGVKQIDGVWYHWCPHSLNRNFADEIQEMCRSFVWHFIETENVSGKFDIVHAHDWLASNSMVWIKEGRRDHRGVLTMHSTEYGRCGNNFYGGVSARIRDHERHGTFCADRVIAVSNTLKGELMWMYNLPDWKCWSIYNGVPISRFNVEVDAGAVKRSWGVGPLDPTVLFMGRLSVQKGPDLMVEAIPGLLRFYPNAKFVIAGEGHMRDELQHRVHQLGVAHAVRWFGRLSLTQQVEMFKACDAVCVPSRNEPFGIIVLEAWAASKPVVASQIGGPGEFVWHNVNGLKVYPTVDSIGWGLGTLFTNWDWARWMGRNGRTAAETAFTWDKIAEQTEHCYKQACQ